MRISYLPTPVANYAAGGNPRTSPGPRRRTYAFYDVGSARMVAAGAPHTGGLRTGLGVLGRGGSRYVCNTWRHNMLRRAQHAVSLLQHQVVRLVPPYLVGAFAPIAPHGRAMAREWLASAAARAHCIGVAPAWRQSYGVLGTGDDRPLARRSLDDLQER